MPQHAQLYVAVPRQENALSKGRRHPEVSAGISWNSLVRVEVMVVKQSRRCAKHNVTGCRSEDTSRRPICNRPFPWNIIQTGNVKISSACNTNRNRSDHTKFADTAHSEEQRECILIQLRVPSKTKIPTAVRWTREEPRSSSHL